MTTVQQVITLMEQLAPRSYAESWDNVGLMVGDRGRDGEIEMLSLQAC